MSWITDFVRPRIKKLIGDRASSTATLWHKCPDCSEMVFHRDLESQGHICPKCEGHFRMGLFKRLDMLFDDAKYEVVETEMPEADPLKFRDRKKYTERIREAVERTGRPDAVVVSRGKIGRVSSVVVGLDFEFMAGSMGVAVGSGFVRAARLSVELKAPLIVIVASGGARMQEGILSLMQMPRTVAALQLVKNEKLPYIVIHTDPTTGGVSASFAMLGDIHIAEPGATIGFAGRRVIEQTVREILPDNFQSAEYLKAHGMVDLVISRRDLPERLGRILDMIMRPVVKEARKRSGSPQHIANDFDEFPVAAD